MAVVPSKSAARAEQASECFKMKFLVGAVEICATRDRLFDPVTGVRRFSNSNLKKSFVLAEGLMKRTLDAR
jgi:hypothetical protein